MQEKEKTTVKVDKSLLEGFRKLSTTNVSDALDKAGLKCGIHGIGPLFKCNKVVGTAVTMKVCPLGETKPTSHMGADPVNVAGPGDIIVIDNSGRLDQNCWGEILTYAAMQKGIEGVIIDGASRDVDVIEQLGFPVYARGIVPSTGRGRNMQESFNTLIQIGGVQVAPGDIIMADMNGVVVIPAKHAEKVLEIGLDIFKREEDIVNKIKSGISFLEVDKQSGYDKMLEKK